MKTHWPLIGMLVAIGLFVWAAAYYPGGTTASANSVGYDWTHNFISTLFAPTALNGAANPARYFAVPAMLMLCVSLAYVFKSISMKTESKPHRKTIEIAGIGSSVYTFLIVTPMHDLMVTISLLFFMTAMLALLCSVYSGRERRLLFPGLVCVSLLLASVVIYYGHIHYELLPIMQKLTFIACVSWLFAVYYSVLRNPARALQL